MKVQKVDIQVTNAKIMQARVMQGVTSPFRQAKRGFSMKTISELHIVQGHLWQLRVRPATRVKVEGIDVDSGAVYYKTLPQRSRFGTGAMTLTEFIKQYEPTPRATS